MALSLQPDESIAAVADSMARFCAGAASNGDFRARWSGLADLGFFSLGSIFAGSDKAALAAGMEVLGRRSFFGPLADTLAFTACAPADLLEPVMAGRVAVSLGRPPLIPFPAPDCACVADIDGMAVLMEIVSAEPVEMLSGQPWARVEARPGRPLGRFAPWADVYDLAIAAWLVGAGLDLVEAAAEHATRRIQFRRAIGEFQAVSAPLARSVLALDGAKVLVEAAAAALDAGSSHLVRSARWSASRAAEQAAITAHQTYGAFGVIEDGPVYARSRLIRQAPHQFPEERPIDALAALGASGSLGLVREALNG